MAPEKGSKVGSTFPVAAMFWIAILGALVSGFSFVIIKHWPIPVAVAPVFGFKMGALWGLVVGGVSGLVLGFCTDESHFDGSK